MRTSCIVTAAETDVDVDVDVDIDAACLVTSRQ